MPDNNTRTLTANFTADTSGFSPKINDLVQKLKKASEEFEQNKAKITSLKEVMKVYQKELTNLEKKQRDKTTLTAEETKKMNELRENIAKCATEMGSYTARQRELSSNMNSLNRQLSEARDEFNGTGQAAATFGEVLKANIASEAILGAIRKIVDGLRKAAAYCYSTGSAFEAGMRKVAAVSGASADDLERLTEKAKELGASTKFTATETAEAMNYMAMAGWKTEQMLEGIDGVLGLAAASGTDLATTSDIVTDALTAFGMKAEDCAHFADVLAAASSNANTNVSMMGETFKYCAPIAGALGFKAEDVAVGIGLMANAGVKATNAGTAMRKFMTELSEGLTITGEKIGEVTISTSNADGSMRSYAEILKELRDVFSQLTKSEKSAAAKDIVGQNALSGFLAMMNASEADVNKLTEAIRNCDGAAANMAKTMGDNVQGAVTKMNSALESVGNAVYDKFKGGLLDAVNIFTETLGDLKTDIDAGGLGESVEDLGESFKNLAAGAVSVAKDVLPTLINVLSGLMNVASELSPVIAGTVKAFLTFHVVKAIGSIITGIGKAFVTLASNIKTAGGAMNTLKAAFASNPFGMIAMAASAVVFGISVIINNINNAAESAEELRQKAEKLAQSAAEYKQNAADLSDIKKQYEDIHNAIDPDIDKSQALKELQDQLIQQFPELADKVDLLKDSYTDVTKSIDDMMDTENKHFQQFAQNAIDTAERAEKESRGIAGEYAAAVIDFLRITISGNKEKYGNIGITRETLDNIKTYKDALDVLEKYNASFFDESGNALEQSTVGMRNDIQEAIEETQKAINDIERYKTELNENNGKHTDSDDTSSYGGAWRNKEEADKEQRRQAEKKAEEDRKKEELKAAKEKYDEEKQLADDRYSVGEMSEADYYARLTELRDEFLETQSHDWYVATAKIKSYQDQNLKDQKSSLSETERAYKETLAAIDAEIERHKRAKSDREYEEKLAAIDDQMLYGRLDEFEKYELEKERKRLQEEREEEMFSRSSADAKSAVTDAYNAQKALENASENTKEYTMALGDYTDALENLSGVLGVVSKTFSVNGTAHSSVTNIDESTNNQYVNNVVLQAVNRSNDQLINRLIKALTSKL